MTLVHSRSAEHFGVAEHTGMSRILYLEDDPLNT